MKITSLKDRLIIIDILTETADILEEFGEIYRSKHYRENIKKVKESTDPSLSPNFEDKITRILEKGELSELTELREYKKLSHLPGFGIKTIRKMIEEKEAGHEPEYTKLQKIGLEYKINRTIPYERAEEIISQIREILDRENAYEVFEAVGSFRRQKNVLGDIDIIMISDISLEEIGNYLIDDLEVVILNQGDKKISFLIPDTSTEEYIQVDIRIATKKSYPFMLLYFTGSRLFNIILRRRAKDRGWKLNEYGLYDSEENEIPGIRLEEDIINKLGMNEKYLDPINREK